MAALQVSNTSVSPLDAPWALFKSQPKAVRNAFVRRLHEEDAEIVKQKKAVKDSLTQSLHELKLSQEGKLQLKDARDFFK